MSWSSGNHSPIQTSTQPSCSASTWAVSGDGHTVLDAIVRVRPSAQMGPPMRRALMPPSRWALASLRLYRIRCSQYRRSVRPSRHATASSISSGGRKISSRTGRRDRRPRSSLRQKSTPVRKLRYSENRSVGDNSNISRARMRRSRMTWKPDSPASSPPPMLRIVSNPMTGCYFRRVARLRSLAWSELADLDRGAVGADLGPVAAHLGSVEAHREHGVAATDPGLLDHPVNDLRAAVREVLGHALQLAACQ